jgi:hypothetical protein
MAGQDIFVNQAEKAGQGNFSNYANLAGYFHNLIELVGQFSNNANSTGQDSSINHTETAGEGGFNNHTDLTGHFDNHTDSAGQVFSENNRNTHPSQVQIQKHACKLMHHPSTDSPWTGITDAHDPAVDGFQLGGPACCTPEHFKIDIRGNPRSPWNKSAAKVFARDFIQHDYICKDYDLVQDKFLTHIKGLKSCFALETKQESARETKRKAASKRERKRGVSAKPNLGPIY